MTLGLLAKTALFPLHLWLPPAHAGAPAPGQRHAFGAGGQGIVLPDRPALVRRDAWRAEHAAAQVLAALGAVAILFGSVLALRQARLKLLIAYSTIAQIGYLFFIFPLASTPGRRDRTASPGQPRLDRRCAPTLLARRRQGRHVHGSRPDRRGAGPRQDRRTRRHRPALPMTIFAFGLAGLSLMGLPPSGGFVAKRCCCRRRSPRANGGGPSVILVAGCSRPATCSACSPGAGRRERTPDAACAGVPARAGRGAGAGVLRAAARPRAAAALRYCSQVRGVTSASAWPVRAMNGALEQCCWRQHLPCRSPCCWPACRVPAQRRACRRCWRSRRCRRLPQRSAGARAGRSVLPQALLGLRFVLDGQVRCCSEVAALLWIAAGVYASAWLRGHPNGGRFAVWWLLTLRAASASSWPPTW